MRKFWNWVRNSADERTLYLNGPIAEESWWGDEVTPKLFKGELLSGAVLFRWGEETHPRLNPAPESPNDFPQPPWRQP